MYYSAQSVLGRFGGEATSKTRTSKPAKGNKGQRDAVGGVVEAAVGGILDVAAEADEDLKSLLERRKFKPSIKIEHLAPSGKPHVHRFIPGQIPFLLDEDGRAWFKFGSEFLSKWCGHSAVEAIPCTALLTRDGKVLTELKARAASQTPAKAAGGKADTKAAVDADLLHPTVKVEFLDDPLLVFGTTKRVYVDDEGYGWVTTSLTGMAQFARRWGVGSIAGPGAAQEDGVKFEKTFTKLKEDANKAKEEDADAGKGDDDRVAMPAE